LLTYIFKRVLLAIPTVFGITIIIFLAMRVLPGDPLAVITDPTTGAQQRLSDEDINKLRSSLGLNDPYYVQYGRWMADVARGDFGYSFWRGEPIRDQILRRGQITAEIALFAIVFSWLVGVPLGILSATRRNTWVDVFARGLATVFQAVPSYWLGLVVVLLGILWFSWRPPISIVYFQDDPGRNLQLVLGPAFAIGIGSAAVIARLTRSSILEALYQDYARTARAKGLRERLVVYRHILRNALLPVVTLTGLQFGGLLGGAIATERAFGVPGLGSAFGQALGERDWTIIQNLVLIAGLTYVVINILVDLSYAWLDPRIRLS